MPRISKERFGEIAALFMLKKYEKEGITFNPSTVKREINNGANSLGIEKVEMAECLKITYQHIYEKTMKELDAFINQEEKENRASIS